MDFLTIVKAMAALSLVSLMFWMGIKVKIEDVLASFKNLRLLGFSCMVNFLMVPTITVGLNYIFSPDLLISVGFLVLGVCPGAPMGPPFVAIAKGDVSAAIGMMIILSTVSAFLSPVILGVLISYFTSGNNLDIDYFAIVRTLFLIQILPLGIGLFLHHRAPLFSQGLVKPLGILSNLLLLATVLLILIGEYETLMTIQLRNWLAMFILFFGSLGIGWLCGGTDKKMRNTLAITTGIRNSAIALVIVSNNFSGTLAVTAVVAYSLLSIICGFGFAYCLSLVPIINLVELDN